MNTEEKLYQKIKEAAEIETNKNFEAMDKVWEKIETKLENKTLKKENKHWKTFGVAASFVLFVSIGTLIYNLNQDEIAPVTNPEIDNKVVETNKNEAIRELEITNNQIVNPNIKDQIKINVPTKESIVYNNENKNEEVAEETPISNFSPLQSSENSKSMEREKYGYKITTVPQDKVVKFAIPIAEKTENQEETKQVEPKKMNPLYVINGEVAKNGKKTMTDLDIESLIELKEPLYIINGVHYTEQEMFGPNPTSPYAPLDEQDITELKILLEEEALKIYGEKGKKGVVIVSTKNNKPKAP